MSKAMSITEFNEKYPDEDACWAHLYQARYPNGFVCPKCGDTREPWDTARSIAFWPATLALFALSVRNTRDTRRGYARNKTPGRVFA